jgi:putative aldouronate transport system permease protein
MKKGNFKKIIKKFDWFDYLNMFIMILVIFITLYPIYFILIGSFSNGDAYMGGGTWLLPKKPTFSNYTVIFSDPNLWYALRNTLIKTIVGTLTSLTFTALIAYAMSRKELKFKKVFYGINIFTMFFSGGLIPYFLIINYLGLFDNFLVYIIPSLYSVYNMIVLSTFFRTIPEELHESATMDGAREFQIWWKIYLPLSKPVLATVALWSIVGHWNSYFSTMIYSNAGPNMITLQYYLMGVINRASYSTGGVGADVLLEVTPTTVSYAAIIIAIIPILIAYPLLQRYFTKGVMDGAVKG